MGNMDPRVNERAADKILDVFSDGKLTDGDLMYVAMHVVMRARTNGIITRILDFAEHIRWELDRQEKNRANDTDSIF